MRFPDAGLREPRAGARRCRDATTSDVLLAGGAPLSAPCWRHSPTHFRAAAADIERVICTHEPRPPSACCVEARAGRTARNRSRPCARRRRNDCAAVSRVTWTTSSSRRCARIRTGVMARCRSCADDVSRHLDGRPVRARADHWRYRSGQVHRPAPLRRRRGRDARRAAHGGGHYDDIAGALDRARSATSPSRRAHARSSSRDWSSACSRPRIRAGNRVRM